MSSFFSFTKQLHNRTIAQSHNHTITQSHNGVISRLGLWYWGIYRRCERVLELNGTATALPLIVTLNSQKG